MQKSYIDIRSRKEMFHCFLGNFRSRFHGSGMEFRDFHPYNYSSDAKNIDWAVSSRQTFPVMRRYHEEKEATIYIVIDITSYLDVSHNPQEKTIRDVTELLAYSAEKSGNSLSVFTVIGDTITQIAKNYREFLGQDMSSLLQKSDTPISRSDFLAQRTFHGGVVFFISGNESPDFSLFNASAQKHDFVYLHISRYFDNTLEGKGIDFFTDGAGFLGLSLENHTKKKRYQKLRKDKLRAFKNAAQKRNIGYINIDEKTDILQSFLIFMRERLGKK